MNQRIKKNIYNLLIVIAFGLVPSLAGQFRVQQPVRKDIHVSSFRYGKEPSVIRSNRGDTLHLTFSTEDTGHSFFLEEFDIDAKVSPARNEVEVFKVSDPTHKPEVTREVILIARHPGIQNYLVSKSNYRCHVWCGPMHAFEHGKLIILPNTLLLFSLGSLTGILFIWFIGFYRKTVPHPAVEDSRKGYRDLFDRWPFFRKLTVSRWPQIIMIMLAMLLVYIVILATFFGTKMSGRNLGVLLMWAVWLFLLVALLTPFLGRIWCTICPLPVFGEFFQRKSFFSPAEGRKGQYRNSYRGLFLKWPGWLSNDWPKLFVLLALTTFSTTLVSLPVVTGFAVIAMLVVPALLALVFEHRAFCRYLCPVSGFIGPFSKMSTVALRNKSQSVCDKCKGNFCQTGSPKGWACPYGINVGEMTESSDCGLCLECTRSCLYNNVTVYSRPFATETGTRHMSEAFLTIGVFTLAIVYSILYQGHWPVVRDFVNIMDKGNWGLFAIYAALVWILALIIVPGFFYLAAAAGVRLSGADISASHTFKGIAGALLPLGLILWIAFVIPMLFVNVTFVLQSFSDPFGWGWDFFGTANIPWHQFLPRSVPWIQAILVLTGLYLSLRNLKRTWINQLADQRQLMRLIFPAAILIFVTAAAMIVFFTN